MTAAGKRHRTSKCAGNLRHRALRFEPLEMRLALDAEGGALAGIDPHLTLSFADDGAPVAGQLNSLGATFDAIASTAVWREQILRAFQTWAIHTNADVGVVADGGQAFGSPGARQRDTRFGDIRVGAIATSPEVGAVSVPLTNLISGTWLADVIFNTQFAYQSVDDILAVAIHEAGNVFGLADSTDPNSPLFTGGPPTVKLPTAADVAALQALHGVRAADLNESHRNDNGQFADNDSFLQATELKLVEPPGGNAGFAPTIVYGDVGSGSDVDYFSIATPGGYSGAVTFDLRSAGISLLQPDVTVFDASEQLIAHVSSQAIGGASVAVNIPATMPQQVFFVRVAGADPDVFGIGGYSLVAKFDDINVVDQATIDSIAGGAYRYFTQEKLAKFLEQDGYEFFNDDGHSDDAAELGMELPTVPGFAEGTRYSAVASIADQTDVDYYVVTSPPAGGPSASVLTTSVRSLEAGGLTPTILVLDENLNPLSAQIVVNGGGELLVQLAGVNPDTNYVIGVRAADPGGPFDTGNYELTAIFTSSPVALQSMAQGTVGGTSNGNLHTVYIGRAQLFHFVLDTGTATATVPTAVVVTIKDENSVPVAAFASPPGERRSPPAVLLEPGIYTVEVIALTLDGSLPPVVDYNLLGKSISDPFVGDPADPNSHPFACMDPDLAGFFCYPGNIISADPFLWDDFVTSLPEPPPTLDLTQLVDLLIGDWWSWVWHQIGSNGPPLAQDDTFVTTLAAAGGASLYGDLGPTSNVLANDIDPEGDATIAALASTTLHGSLNLLPDGTFNYVPDAGFVGTDRFTYVAHDFTQSSNVATVRLVVGSGLTGDYDANGIVDNDDSLAWRANFGSVDELLADGNRNGAVDAADYVVWRMNLGASLGSGATALAAQASTQENPSGIAAAVVTVPQQATPVSGQQQAISAGPSSGFLAVPQSAPQQTVPAKSQVSAAGGTSPTDEASLLLAVRSDKDSRRGSTNESSSMRIRDCLADAVFNEWPGKLQRPLRNETIPSTGALGRWRL